jgi:hypothetical protein
MHEITGQMQTGTMLPFAVMIWMFAQGSKPSFSAPHPDDR